MKKKKQTLLLGAHISIAGGMEKSIERGESIGCTAIQIFTKSNRQWFAKPLEKETISAFKEAKKNSFIQDVLAHSSYLINIGSPKKIIEEKSINALIEELARCTQLDIPYLVLHPGSHGDTNERECLVRIAQNLDEVFKHVPGKTKILLENMAGQGTSVCHQFEHLAHIFSSIKTKNRIGICFDLCHAFAAGYYFSKEKNYKRLWEHFDSILGLEHLKAIHINDSKKELGSRVDRHADIGKGAIGLEGFRLLFNDERFFSIPKILETPKQTLEDDLRNMRVIKDLISEKNRKILEIKVM